ncbi:unnamed protein product, partial [Meganyctiphanes norvegica]
MDYKLPLLLVLHGLLGGAAGFYQECYWCVLEVGHPLYDPHCNDTDYNGYSEAHTSFDYSGCAVNVYEDGYVWRGFQLHDPDHCTTLYSDDRHVNYTHCWCLDFNCNNGLCEECFDSPTTTTQQPHTKG